MSNDTQNLVLAVPSKGRLQENANNFFKRAGLTVVQGRGVRDYRGALASGVGRLRIGIDRAYVADKVETPVIAAFDAAIATLCTLGARTVAATMPDWKSAVTAGATARRRSPRPRGSESTDGARRRHGVSAARARGRGSCGGARGGRATAFSRVNPAGLC